MQSLPVAFKGHFSRSARPSRRGLRCTAMADNDKKLSFEANKRAALGFTESDSAGQTNVFAVEPKSYVAGSSSDKTKAAGNSTVGAAAIAGSVAAGAVIAGLLLINGSNDVDLGPSGDFKTLTEYKAQFTAEINAPSSE